MLFRSEVHAEGRSVARIDDELVTIARLANEMGARVEIHGQHDQQRLGDPARQRDLLDRWSKSVDLRAGVALLIDQRTEIRTEIDALGGDDARREALLEVARTERDDLREAAIEPGEGDRLREELKRASNIGRVEALDSEISALLDGDSDALRSRSAGLDRLAREAAKLDPSRAALAERIAALAIEIEIGRAHV